MKACYLHANAGRNVPCWFGCKGTCELAIAGSRRRRPIDNGAAAFPWQLPWIVNGGDYWDGQYGITIAGAGVSDWKSMIQARSFTQGTDANRPAYASGVITFDGVDNFLNTDAFTLASPFTVLLAFKQITWADNDYIFDGNTGNTGTLRQANAGASPQLEIRGSVVAGNFNGDLAIDTYGIVTALFNGVSSLLKVNLATSVTTSVGTADPGGITLGASGVNSLFSNIAVKGMCYAASALTAAQIEQTVRAMARRYAVSV